MSREEIPWNRVAQEIMRTLGLETARALYYALIMQSVYPAMTRLIQQLLASGGTRSDDVAKAIQELQKLMQQQAAFPLQPPSDPQQLQMALAQMLQRSYSQFQPSGLPPTPPVSPPVRPPPELEERVRSLEREIETLERVRQELLSKYMLSFNEEERRQIEQRLREVEDRLRDRRGELALLRSQVQVYR